MWGHLTCERREVRLKGCCHEGLHGEFCSDVVKVARHGKEPGRKIADGFGVPPENLSNCIRPADIDDGGRDGASKEQKHYL